MEKWKWAGLEGKRQGSRQGNNVRYIQRAWEQKRENDRAKDV